MSSRRRGGSAGWAVVIVLIVVGVLVGGLVFADGYARREVARRVGVDLQSQLGTPDPPRVEIEGTPFLTQVATQNLRSMHLIADQVGATNEADLVVRHVDLRLTDVTSDDWFATMTVGHAEGTAVVDYDQLRSLGDVPLEYVGGGRFQIEVSTSMLQVPVKAVVIGRLELDARDQTVTLVDPEVEIANVNLPDAVAAALIRAVVRPIPLTGVPFGLEITAIDARDDGLHAEINGDSIQLTR